MGALSTHHEGAVILRALRAGQAGMCGVGWGQQRVAMAMCAIANAIEWRIRQVSLRDGDRVMAGLLAECVGNGGRAVVGGAGADGDAGAQIRDVEGRAAIARTKCRPDGIEQVRIRSPTDGTPITDEPAAWDNAAGKFGDGADRREREKQCVELAEVSIPGRAPRVWAGADRWLGEA